MDSELLTLSNLRGELRAEALRLVDQIFGDLQSAILAPKNIDEYGTDSVVGDALHNREKELLAAEKLIGIIVREWHVMDLNISRQDFEFELSKLEARVEHLMADTLVIQGCRYELGGRLLDDMIGAEDGRRISSTWSHVDSLIEDYKTAKRAKLPVYKPPETIAQWLFCQRVFKSYGTEDGIVDWCVISGWQLRTTVRGAQIVRYNLGEKCAQYLFAPLNELDGHLLGVANGLPMHIRYAEALDNGRLVIIPDKVQDEDQGRKQGYISRWKVYNLYEADAHQSHPHMPLGSDLHGRALQFRNDFRPDARYLFFVFCVSVLRRQRHEASGWWRAYLAGGPGEAWAAASGTFLRPSTLRKLAQRIGRLTEEEAAQFVMEAGNGRVTEPSDGDKRVEEKDSRYADLCCVAARQPSPNKLTTLTRLGPYNQGYEDVLADLEPNVSGDEADEELWDDDDDDEG